MTFSLPSFGLKQFSVSVSVRHLCLKLTVLPPPLAREYGNFEVEEARADHIQMQAVRLLISKAPGMRVRTAAYHDVAANDCDWNRLILL